MKKIIQPIDLPRNKDKDWLKRATLAISEKDLHSLDILARELESLSSQEKEQFVDDELWKKTLEEVKKQTTEKGKINEYKKYLKFTNIAYYEAKAQSAIDTLQYIIDERVAWLRTKNQNTKISYERYIEQFFKSDNINEAKKRLTKIVETENKAYQERLKKEEEEAWTNALRLNTKSSYEDYLLIYSNHLHSNKAKEKIEDIKSWEKSQKIDTVEAYEEYCSEIKNGQFIKQAKDRQQILLLDKEAWEEAQDTNTLVSYNEYLSKFSNGKFVEEANELLFTIKLDKKLWDEAKKENTRTSYKEYLNKYPNSIYANTAKKIISEIDFWDNIKDSYNSCKYKDWWEKSLCFQNKYKEYLNSYPNGIYVEEANKALKHIKILHKIVSIIGVIALIIGIYFIFFDISNTKVYIEPYDAKIYLNGKQIFLSNGDEIELPKKVNTIKAEKKHYVTQELNNIKQGVKSIDIDLTSFCSQGEMLFKQKKYDEALKFFEPIVSDSCSWFELGYIYSHKGDRKKSIKYYTKSCEQSYMPSGASCNNLGVEYKDYDNYEAFKYFKKSSELGDEYGYCNLAKMYYKGKGTSQSSMLARKYFNKIKYFDCSLKDDLDSGTLDTILNIISPLTPED